MLQKITAKKLRKFTRKLWKFAKQSQKYCKKLQTLYAHSGKAESPPELQPLGKSMVLEWLQAAVIVKVATLRLHNPTLGGGGSWNWVWRGLFRATREYHITPPIKKECWLEQGELHVETCHSKRTTAFFEYSVSQPPPWFCLLCTASQRRFYASRVRN